MRHIRCIEAIAWIAGAMLLCIYGAARTWSSQVSAAAVASWSQQRAAGLAQLASQTGLTAPTPDTATWSQSRLAAWRKSLGFAHAPDALLKIPSVGLTVPVFEGVNELNLNLGAARVEGTARIGEPGNIGLAAHRDGFFRALRDVRVGDVVFLETLSGSTAYRVVSTRVVDPDAIEVLAPTSTPSVTLVTCYPFYFVGAAPQRFIVRAQAPN